MPDAPICPMCRRPWEFKAENNRMGDGGGAQRTLPPPPPPPRTLDPGTPQSSSDGSMIDSDVSMDSSST